MDQSKAGIFAGAKSMDLQHLRPRPCVKTIKQLVGIFKELFKKILTLKSVGKVQEQKQTKLEYYSQEYSNKTVEIPFNKLFISLIKNDRCFPTKE